MTQKQIDIAVERIIEYYDSFKNSRLYRHSKLNGSYYWNKYSSYHYTFLNEIRKEYARFNSKANKLVYDKMQELIYGEDDCINEMEEYVDIIRNLDLHELTCNVSKILSNFLDNSHFIQDVKLLLMKSVIPKTPRYRR